MRRLALCLLLSSSTAAMAENRGGDFQACTQGQVEVAKRAADFQGEEMIKKLIAADLRRARKEEAEGDADECLEALDHAKKLIAGDY